MIDTLRIRPDDYTISKNTIIERTPATEIYGTGELKGNFLLYQDENHSVYGLMCKKNTDNFQLTLSYKKGVGSICSIQFSLPKIYNGDNFHSVGRQGGKAALKKLESQLKDIGFYCNLENAYLSRLDTFKNIETEEDFSAYKKIFSECDVPRKEARQYGGTTFLYKNESHQICVYDKINEMKSKNHDVRSLPANIMRIENRYMKAAKIKASLGGMSKVVELFDNYDYVKQVYNQDMLKTLFRFNSDQIITNTKKSLIDGLISDYHDNSYGWPKNFLQSHGALNLIPLGLMDAIEEALKQVGLNPENERKKLRRVMDEIKKIEKKELMISSAGTKDKAKLIVNLYDELKTKVLAVA